MYVYYMYVHYTVCEGVCMAVQVYVKVYVKTEYMYVCVLYMKYVYMCII